jgi:hypothetical protein
MFLQIFIAVVIIPTYIVCSGGLIIYIMVKLALNQDKTVREVFDFGKKKHRNI